MVFFQQVVGWFGGRLGVVVDGFGLLKSRGEVCVAACGGFGVCGEHKPRRPQVDDLFCSFLFFSFGSIFLKFDIFHFLGWDTLMNYVGGFRSCLVGGTFL